MINLEINLINSMKRKSEKRFWDFWKENKVILVAFFIGALLILSLLLVLIDKVIL